MDTYNSAIEVSIVGWRAQPTNNKLQKENSVNADSAFTLIINSRRTIVNADSAFTLINVVQQF